MIAAPSDIAAGQCFSELSLQGRYEQDDKPRDTFLLPLLREAAGYDRVAGYFSSSSLAAAADGLEPFITAGGRIRMVVNHHLRDEDVDAVQRGLDLREAVAADVSKVGLSASGVDDGNAPQRLRLLCTLVALGQLDVKVAVATGPDGEPLRAEMSQHLHHAKFGVFSDRCSPPCQIAFEGSNNESLSGWMANYETYSAYPSWNDHVWETYGAKVAADFARHWDGVPPSGWVVVDLPTAAHDGLLAGADVDLARRGLEAQHRDDEVDDVVARILAARGETQPTDPLADLDDLLTSPRRFAGVGVGSSVVEPWPHQYDVARKVIGGWPVSRLLADEVGLGKTIEVGLVVRDLLVSGRVRRSLLLVPASVVWQWQSELWEKFTVAVPVLDGSRLVWPRGSRPGDDLDEPVAGNRWGRRRRDARLVASGPPSVRAAATDSAEVGPRRRR